QIGHIPPGEHVALKDQQQAQMLSKHRRATKGEYVYNFEVYKDHHYFVGEGLAWVHNCKTISGTRGLRHSFDRHAAQWFGGAPGVTTHLDEWESLITRASRSKKSFNWRTGNDDTVAHLARIDGKYLLVQFFKDGPRAGELATAFVPNQKQLRQIFKILN
ncbi:MAG: hypothetical protein AAFP00_07445, partial [Bacteroidota bacterium]